MTYGVFLFVGGGGVSGRDGIVGISDGFVGRSGAVEICGDNSNDGEDNNDISGWIGFDSMEMGMDIR